MDYEELVTKRFYVPRTSVMKKYLWTYMHIKNIVGHRRPGKEYTFMYIKIGDVVAQVVLGNDKVVSELPQLIKWIKGGL